MSVVNTFGKATSSMTVSKRSMSGRYLLNSPRISYELVGIVLFLKCRVQIIGFMTTFLEKCVIL